ncbi:MAG: DUF3156 family protein [Clostridia bacterium]
MNIYENVDKRAAKALALLAQLFPFTWQQENMFTYRAEGKKPAAWWELHYTAGKKKKWLSRIFKAEVSYTFPLAEQREQRLYWIPSKKVWKNEANAACPLAQRLSADKEITSLLTSVDMERVEIVQKGEAATITIVPIPGCFVWTMIPPFHYYVRLKAEEANTIMGVAQRLESKILHADKV